MYLFAYKYQYADEGSTFPESLGAERKENYSLGGDAAADNFNVIGA